MIFGRIDPSGRPTIRGWIYLPELGIQGEIPFLYDTGADGSCINLQDAVRLRIPMDWLRANRGTSPSRGIGGTTGYYSESAMVAFEDKRLWSTWLVGYRLDIGIIDFHSLEDPEGNMWMPSLLGMDVICRWKTQIDPSRGRQFRITPRHWDARQRLEK